MPEPRLPLGEIVATQGAAAKLTHLQMCDLLARHRRGDWGEVPLEDAQENELSLSRRPGFPCIFRGRGAASRGERGASAPCLRDRTGG